MICSATGLGSVRFDHEDHLGAAVSDVSDRQTKYDCLDDLGHRSMLEPGFGSPWLV